MYSVIMMGKMALERLRLYNVYLEYKIIQVLISMSLTIIG